MRRTAALLVVALAVLLAGCAAPATQQPSGRSTLTATPPADAPPTITATPGSPRPTIPVRPTADCVDGALRVNAPGEYEIGDCGTVDVESTDITLRAGDIQLLTVHGDRVSISADDVGTADIEGNDDALTASTAGVVTIRGDRNAVTVSGSLGALAIGGNDDTVRAGTIGSSDVRGDRNIVTP